MRLAVLLFAGIVVSFARAARAEEHDDKAWSTPFVVGARLEAFPIFLTGFNGATFEVMPTRAASLEVGGGSWLYGPAALAIGHLQAPFRRMSIGLEAGLLASSFALGDCQFDPVGFEGCGAGNRASASGDSISLHVRNAVFGRLGASFSLRTEGGRFKVRLFAGATTLLRRNVGVWVDDVTGRELRGGEVIESFTLPPMFYAGVSLGYGFRI